MYLLLFLIFYNWYVDMEYVVSFSDFVVALKLLIMHDIQCVVTLMAFVATETGHCQGQACQSFEDLFLVPRLIAARYNSGTTKIKKSFLTW